MTRSASFSGWLLEIGRRLSVQMNDYPRQNPAYRLTFISIRGAHRCAPMFPLASFLVDIRASGKRSASEAESGRYDTTSFTASMATNDEELATCGSMVMLSPRVRRKLRMSAVRTFSR